LGGLSLIPEFSELYVARIEYFATLSHDLSRRYLGYPVYLVGGALLRDEEPRDVDLVIELPQDVFEYAYGKYDDWIVGKVWSNETWLRWARDVAKISENLSHESRRMVDFRTQHPKTSHLYRDLPKMRLSTEIVRGR